jgi:hypothetical protein
MRPWGIVNERGERASAAEAVQLYAPLDSRFRENDKGRIPYTRGENARKSRS